MKIINDFNMVIDISYIYFNQYFSFERRNEATE